MAIQGTRVPDILGKDVITMSVKKRILTIRLLEKLAEKPVLADELGLTPVIEIVISNRQDDSA